MKQEEILEILDFAKGFLIEEVLNFPCIKILIF